MKESRPTTQSAARTAGGSEAARLAAVARYDILDTPPDGAFDRVCALAARVFDVPISTVTIVDEDRIWFKARQGLDAVEIPRAPGLCASAILQDEPYVVTDGVTDERTAGNELVHGEMGVRFYAAAPIVTSDGHRLGTLNVIDSKPREVTDGEQQTLTELAAIVMDELELRLAAIREVQRERKEREAAVDHQRRTEQLARTLQQSLSPARLPDVDVLDVAVHYQAFAIEDVGGDFYDLFPLGAGRYAFFLGDVCGKGPAAASLTSLARYTLRTAALLNAGPAQVLAELNGALLMEDPSRAAMCTAIYGELEATADGVAGSIAVAGHPPPLVVRADGRVEPVDVLGPMLGATSQVEFATAGLMLAPGDAIVLFTDGLLDTILDGKRVDEARVAEVLAETPGGATAAELVGRLTGLLAALERPARDDVAILVLRAQAAASSP